MENDVYFTFSNINFVRVLWNNYDSLIGGCFYFYPVFKFECGETPCMVNKYFLIGPDVFLRLPHTSRFLVVEQQIFCRGQIGLKFVGPSDCRTLADFLSRLTALRLGAGSIKIKMAPIPLT